MTPTSPDEDPPRRTLVYLRLVLLLVLSGGLMLIATPGAFMGTFGVVASLGQSYDPGSPGDFWLFIGFCVAAVVGPVAGLGAASLPWIFAGFLWKGSHRAGPQ